MKKAAAQGLRLGGMMIEMLGVMGIMTGQGNIESLRLQLPGGTPVSPAYILFAVGLMMWLAGTILITSLRSQRTRP